MKEIKKWELISEEDVSPSKWFPLFKHTVKLPNGKIIDDFYIEKHGDVGMVIPITKGRTIVFVQQYKHGVGEITIELPSGRMKKGETPEETAKTELREETGAIAENLLELGPVYPATTKGTMRVYGFIGTDIEISKEQDLDETEEINILEVPIAEVDEMIREGKIRQADTIAIWTLAKLKHPELF